MTACSQKPGNVNFRFKNRGHVNFLQTTMVEEAGQVNEGVK